MNEETGNHRPIILGLKSLPQPNTTSAAAAEAAAAAAAAAKEAGVASPSTGENIDWDEFRVIGLEEFDTPSLVRTCVRLMRLRQRMDRDTLHALMRFCVRLTTRHCNAEVFAQAGGVQLLLDMRQTCGYIGFSTMANLLIRHTLEDTDTLRLAMEKVISARTLLTIPPGYRELVFMLRRMSSAVSRDPVVSSTI